MISIENAQFKYGNKIALQSVSFEVKKGEIFALLGPNGGGKSTLFKILSTLAKPQGGEIEIEGIDITKSPSEIRKRLGVVFQNPSLDKRLTVYENLFHQGHLYGLSGKELKKRIDEVLHDFLLKEKKNDRVETLSGGFQRRVEVARAFLHRPVILLMDEPSTGLDPAVRLDVWNLLSKMRKDFGVTILLTTHLMEEAEKCDRVGILDQGKMVTVGTPEELKAKISGDVIELKTNNSNELATKIQAKFQVKAKVFNGSVRVEKGEGHQFLTDVIESFPTEISEVSLRKPSLEDVFLRETGRIFE